MVGEPRLRCARAEMSEYLVGINRVTGLILRDALGEDRVESRALLVVVVVEVVEPFPTHRDELDHGPLGQLRGLIHDEAAIPYTRLQREHLQNVARLDKVT